MRTTYHDIKNNAKAAMKGHFGEVVLVGLILPIAFSMIASFFSTFFGFIHWTLPNFITPVINVIGTYITIRMIIKITRFKSDKIFMDFFGTKKGIISSLGFGLFSLIYTLGYLVFFWDYFVFAWDLFDLFSGDYNTADPNLISNFIENNPLKAPTLFAIIGSSIYSIVVIFISIKLSFTTYVIADSDSSLIESMKKSWELTKGNWWRITFFPLSFILWIFAIMFTFGLAIIYFVPYLAVSYGALYNTLLKEKGFDYDHGPLATPSTPTTNEFALDVEENMFDRKDPFE